MLSEDERAKQKQKSLRFIADPGQDAERDRGWITLLLSLLLLLFLWLWRIPIVWLAGNGFRSATRRLNYSRYCFKDLNTNEKYTLVYSVGSRVARFMDVSHLT